MHPRGFAGGGLSPVRMSQRTFAGDVEYTQPMLCEGVWKNVNDVVPALAAIGSARTRTGAKRIIV